MCQVGTAIRFYSQIVLREVLVFMGLEGMVYPFQILFRLANADFQTAGGGRKII